MNIGVISDTHGNSHAVKKAVEIIDKVDFWLHAGDCSHDAETIRKLTGLPVFAACGNCDSSSKASIYQYVEAGNKKIWLTHGHKYHVKNSIKELVWWAKQYVVDLVVYGHTHVPDITWSDNILIFNPGSAGYPHIGQTASCGILEINGNEITPHIVLIK